MSLPAAVCLVVASLGSGPDGTAIPKVSWPALPRIAHDPRGFARPGWRVEQSVVADLDGKGKADLAFVLKAVDPGCTIEGGNGQPLDTSPRIMVVALASSAGYTLSAANHDVIPRIDDPYMDDPFDIGGLTVKNRVVRLALGWFRSAGGWTTYTNTLSFRFDGAGFALIGSDHDATMRNSGETESVSANLLTRRARITKGSIERDKPDSVRWRTLSARPAPTLATIGNGLDYDPLD